MDGRDGRDGANGAPGNDGKDGLDGQDGVPAPRLVWMEAFSTPELIDPSAYGPVPLNREVTVDKASAASYLRVMFADTINVSGGYPPGLPAGCVVEVTFDDQPCTHPGRIVGQFGTISGTPNFYPPRTVVFGYCDETDAGNLTAGPVSVGLTMLAAVDGGSCIVGDPSVPGTMEVEEITPM